ncbi:MAG: hypothetical protein GQ527_00755 [Bacteroidales bacterium]|nr:hypothetical protein [Bacteroidales bacterium]
MKDVMIISHVLGSVLSIGSIAFFLVIRKNLYKIADGGSGDVYAIISKFQRMTHIGMGIMILSGGYLMTPYWSAFGSMHMLHVKVMAVLLWLMTIILLSVILRKAKAGKGKKCDERLLRMNYASLFFGVIVIIVAVLSFH